jgi:hypothetical protein
MGPGRRRGGAVCGAHLGVGRDAAARDEAATGYAWGEDEVVACSAGRREQDSILSCHGCSLGKSSGVMYLIPVHARALPRP